MAKLTNVKTLNMENGEITKVEYNGNVYDKVGTDSPEIGDIGMIIDAWGSLSNGDFYEVKDIVRYPIGNYPNLGGSAHGCVEDKDTMFFRKVTAQPSGLKKVDAPVVGGNVVFGVDYCDVTAGEIYEIIRVKDSDGFTIIDDVGDDNTFLVRYAKVTFYVKTSEDPYGEISVGDKVKVVVTDGEESEHGWGRVNNGDIGVVTDADFLGSIRVDFPNQKNWCAEESELIKVADNGDLLPGTVVKGNISDKVITLGERDFDRDRSFGTAYLVKDNAPFWIGEEQFEILTKEEAKKHADVAEGVEEDDEAEELIPADEIPVGATVKVVQQGNGHYGDTLRVTKNDRSGLFPYYTEKLDGGFADVYDKEHLEIVEVPAQEEKIEVGDLVKVIQSPAALPEGSYFIVRDISHDGDIWSDSKSGGRYIYAPRHVELIAKADEVYA